MKPYNGHMEIVRALVRQVSLASSGDNEQNVITTISRPMWKAFLSELDIPINTEPSKEWGGTRVFGSFTIVIESDEMWSFSRLRK